MARLGTELAAMTNSAMANSAADSLPSPSPDLTLPRMVRLGLAGIASDLRDRRQDPALRKRPSVHALDPRLHRPVLVIGAPRSGTTFLAGCIGRMPEISYHFEPRLTKAAARCVYDGSWSERRAAAVFRLSYSALLLAALDGGRRFSEKNPENSFVVPFLATALPGAQFVHIVRDGRDVAVSHAEQPWLSAASSGAGRRGRGGQLWGPYPRWWVEQDRREEFVAVPDVVRSAWCWRRFTEAALHGLASLPADRSIEVRYESVVRDPAGTARLLADFIGASPAGHQAVAAGLAEAKPGSVGRWRSALSAQQAAEVEQETGQLLARLGYR
jgi:Sulfotransferase family